VPGFYVENFGCRATQADGAAIEAQLRAQGWGPVPGRERADVVVLNTCTVTAAADRDARAAIRRIHREHPACKIMVTGCYAQRAPAEIARLPGVSWVVGNSHKHEVAGIIAGAPLHPAGAGFVPLDSLQPPAAGAGPLTLVDNFFSSAFAHTELLAAPVFGAGFGARTRPNLKVQDGCDNRCSFCVIPQVRGRSRSLPLDRVLRQVEELTEAGYREIVLSGINLGRWGRDFEPPRKFAELLRAILQHTGMERVRISSVEPMDWSDELIELVAGSPRIAKHAHLPLQSGCDAVLRRMHRKYRPWHYRERVARIRAAMPDAAIGADVMTGFPGETEERFEESRAFIASLPFTYLHVFTYSSRPGTLAAGMPGQVAPQIARQRNRVLRQLAAEKNLEFRRSFVGKTLPAITLKICGQDSTEALADNYLPVRLAGRHAANQWITARIETLTEEGLAGTRAA